MNDLSMILHQVDVKLYPHSFENVKGIYIARTDNERTLTVEDICAILKTRLDFAGKYDDLLNYVRQYLNEVAYQLCDGYAVTNGLYTVSPNIGGSFDSVLDPHDPVKNKVTFSFTPRAKLRRLARNIVVNVAGIADTNGYIAGFKDYDEDAVNSIYVPGNQFAIRGHKIKVEGSDPGIGVFLVPVNNPAAAVKITRIAENNPSKITGILPSTGSQHNRIEVRTQFSGVVGKPNKNLRTITGSFVLEEV